LQRYKCRDCGRTFNLKTSFDGVQSVGKSGRLWFSGD
jgi:transposase-like protein